MPHIPFRQIHLDFHTSELIPDVGVDFNASEFASTLKKAHVDSINIFAKCHHGMSYYPSKVGPMHPSLKFDLLGQMIEALHKEGIACPIYTTVVWDEYAASMHPEWLQVDSHGKMVGREPYTTGDNGAERWKYLCLNSGYMDYLSAQVDEILDGYDADGLWFDIVMYSQDGCSCENCIREMVEKGLDPLSQLDRQTNSFDVLRRAMKRLYTQVKGKKPEAMVFFNGRQSIDANPERSLRRELDYFTHIEIESLPSGHWGYNHFPMFVRYNQMFGKEIIGMNGKFHKSWADFGGFKNKAALDFECFNMLASGTKVCIGDQLHPRGKLDGATYELVGSVFEDIEKKEPWCEGAKPLANIALMAVNEDGYGRACRPGIRTLEAAMQMLLEDQRLYQIIDWEADLDAYELVVFPDRARLNREMAEKVNAFIVKGGKAIFSHESGLKADEDAFAVDFGVDYEGDSPFTATYYRIGGALNKGLHNADYVMYDRGKRVVAKEGEALIQVVEPYFQRSWNHFMSHQQTPADKESRYCAAVRNGNVIYFADPIFTAYKTHGNLVYKKLVSHAIDLLLGKRVVEAGLPSTARLTVLDQPKINRRIVHIVHYPIERRAVIDIIEDVIPLYDISMEVQTPSEPKEVYLAPQRQNLEYTYADGRVRFTIPEVNGHQMVAIECR